jgi:predicted enzyme related to lactoylglutathione lyase
MADVKGRWVWYDLMTTDPASAIPFYKDVVGWGTEEWQGPAPYTMFTADHGPIGGAMQLPDEAQASGAPPHWIAYIGTDDTDAAVAKATSMGANTLVPPQDIPEIGRFAVLSDPQGAVFAVFSPEGEMPVPEGMPGVREFSWHELMTTDHEAAFDFYSKLAGWNETSQFDMGEMGMYKMYGKGEVPYGGMFTKGADMPMPNAWIYYARVDDLDAALGRVKNGGGQVVNGPMEVPGGDRIAQCVDPQGAFFALHETKQGEGEGEGEG